MNSWLHISVPAIATLVLVSCTARQTEPVPVAPSAAPLVIAPVPNPVRALPSAVPPARESISAARTMDEYKNEVARRIYSTSSPDLFEGAPPPMLKSVVVLEIAVDSTGQLKRLALRRSNGYAKLSDLAMQSVRRATPLPRPSRALMRSGVAEFNETWLFRDDGRFQIRSLALVQTAE